MSLQADIARNILDIALRSHVGIRVQIESNPISVGATLRAKQILYRFKQENSEFKILQIRLDPVDPDNFIWITKEEIPVSVSQSPETETRSEVQSDFALDLDLDLE